MLEEFAARQGFTNLVDVYKRQEISNLAEQVSSNASEVENASKSLADGATEQAEMCIRDRNRRYKVIICQPLPKKSGLFTPL